MKERSIFAINHDRDRIGLFGISEAGRGLWYKLLTGNDWQPSQSGWLLVGQPAGVHFGLFHPAAGVKGLQFANTIDTDVFCIADDGQMRHTLIEGGLAWPPASRVWEARGGSFGSALDVQACLPGIPGAAQSSLAIVGIDTNSELQLKLSIVSNTPGNFQFSNATHPIPAQGWEFETDWFPTGGGSFLFEPALPSSASAIIEVFAVRIDGQMLRLEADTTQWPPTVSAEPLNPDEAGQHLCFGSAPAVVASAPGRIEVMATGSSGLIYWRSRGGGAWLNRWSSLGAPFGGGAFDSAPAVVSFGDKTFDVFGLGTDGQMYHRHFDGNRWVAAWESLGGPAKGKAFVCAPAAVAGVSRGGAWGPNRLDVFGLGTDGQMYHRYFDGKQWLPIASWEALGGPRATSRTTQPAHSAAARFATALPGPLPSSITFEGELRLADGTPVGGHVSITLFSDGTSKFSGYLEDTGGYNYACSLASAVIDMGNRAYTFQLTETVYALEDLFQPSTVPWSIESGPNATLRDNWKDIFPCAKSSSALDVDPDPPGGLVNNVSSLLDSMAGGAALTVVPLVGQGP
jgi:hypothetical protein